MNQLTSVRSPLTGLLLTLAVALGATGCVLDATETDDGLGMAEEPLAAWEADHREAEERAWETRAPERAPEPAPPVDYGTNAETGDGSDGTSNPDPTPWNTSTASFAGGDGNPDPTPWLDPDDEEEEEGENEEGRDSEPDPQPWQNEASVETDSQD